MPTRDKPPAALPFTPCSNSLSQPPKPSDSVLHQRFPVDDDLKRYSDRELAELLERKKLTVEKSGPYSSDTGEKLRADDINLYEDELASRKRSRLDDEVEQFSYSSALRLYPTIDLSILDRITIPESPSPPSHSLIESLKCTVRELQALPFTSLTGYQKLCFLEAGHELRKAFPYHPELDRVGRESSSLYVDYISCCKDINELKDKLLPLKEDFETSCQKVAAVKLEMDRTLTEYVKKYDWAVEVEATTLNLRSQIEELQSKLMTEEAEEAEGVLSIGSQIEQLQEKLKSKEAEVVGLRNEADALVFKYGDLSDQHEVLASQHQCLKQFIDSVVPNGRRWSKDLNRARERYVFLTEQWNSLPQLDLDSLAELSSRQSPARDEPSDCIPNILL